jgi:hypothetical protein
MPKLPGPVGFPNFPCLALAQPFSTNRLLDNDGKRRPLDTRLRMSIRCLDAGLMHCLQRTTFTIGKCNKEIPADLGHTRASSRPTPRYPSNPESRLIRGDEQLVQNNCLGWSSAVQISA